MAISQQQIDKLIAKANIVDVIGDYIDLQKKGRNYLAVCPFHDDSDPSMHVSQDKKIFKCFVCGTGGNVITFIQEFNNITFFKALNILAKKLNFKIDGLKEFEDKPKYSSLESKIFAINKKAADFFSGLLISNFSKAARQYLRERKISNQEISKFSIGFSPSKISLYDYLINCEFDKKDILESGLIYSKGINYKGFFENRLIFPITDEENNIIGFSGRVITNDEEPKYKNSSENIVFKKSNLAYNFFNAKKYARIKNEILILEGFMDVISLEKIEINNSVAIMGTSLSDYHVKLFLKVAKTFKLFLDGDKAGINAAIKISKFLLDKRINVKVIENNTGKDPDELVKNGDKNLILQMIENAVHPVDFAINYYSKELNLDDSLQVNEFIQNIIDVLIYETNQTVIQRALIKLNDITRLEIDDLKNILSSQQKPSVSQNVLTNNHEQFWNESIPSSELSDETINSLMNSYDDGFVNLHYPLLEESYQEEQNAPIKKVINNVNNFKKTKQLAESVLVWDLLNNDENLELIEKNLNKINSLNIKNLITFIINEYQTQQYFGNDWEQLALKIKDNYPKLYEIIYQIKNLFFTINSNRVSQKTINDCIDTIKVYELELDINDLNEKINSTNDYELKKSYLTLQEELRKEKVKILEKRRK